MTEKRKPKKLMNRAALREYQQLKQQNELLQRRVQYQEEIISALRDAIQTFQGRAQLEGALHKTDLEQLKAATQ